MQHQKHADNRTGNAVAGGLRGRRRMKTLSRAVLIAAAVLAVGAVVTYIQLENAGVMAARRAEDLLARVAATAQPQQEMMAVAPQGAAVTEPSQKRVLQDIDEDHAVIAKLTIPKLELELPVLAECSDAALEISVCRLTGPSEPGGTGNMVITGHNYRSGAHFGRLDELEEGDTITLMDIWGKQFSYRVSEVTVIKPDDIEALDKFEGEYALALLTCTQHANRRLLVRCVPEG